MKMVSTQERRNQQKKKQLNQLKETLNDFTSGNGNNVSVREIEASEQQTVGQHKDFEGFVDSASQNQIEEKSIHNKNRSAVDNAV